MESSSQISRALIILGVCLALGMSAAAFILGVQTRNVGRGKQTITVKGLAEKSVKADHARWTISLKATGADLSQAVGKLRSHRPALEAFLKQQGFEENAITRMGEETEAHMEEEETSSGQTRMVEKGYDASQVFSIQSVELDKVAKANQAVIDLAMTGLPVKAQAPEYLVSQLEEIKMSLIGAATQNAYARAQEFARTGNAKVGAMSSASQGAFYILAPVSANRESANTFDYGGTYDKSTVDKTARVVVTIEYNIQP